MLALSLGIRRGRNQYAMEQGDKKVLSKSRQVMDPKTGMTKATRNGALMPGQGSAPTVLTVRLGQADARGRHAMARRESLVHRFGTKNERLVPKMGDWSQRQCWRVCMPGTWADS
ncbi:hypothetical protein HAX54_019400 [Datura stramonium]|uniref:Uncharacterized protein n=1 Tax=Datura stramonium TaxID=4076 RepID=A0ABS8S2I9_DATST|nr:hypothetical protein [Datura stramonium]